MVEACGTAPLGEHVQGSGGISSQGKINELELHNVVVELSKSIPFVWFNMPGLCIQAYMHVCAYMNLSVCQFFCL